MRPFTTAVVLAWIAGFVDAVGYLVLSHVFSAHMSGNTVAAAAHLGAGDWKEISRRAFPIPMFVLGVFFGALINRSFGKGARHPFAPAILFEAFLLGAFAALTAHTRGEIAGLRIYPFIGLLSFAMGLQNATLRCAHGMAVRTTFISGMLVNMAENAAARFAQAFRSRGQSRPSRGRHPNGTQALRYGLLWGGMFFGGVCGACLETFWGTIALLFPILGLIVVVVRSRFWPYHPQ